VNLGYFYLVNSDLKNQDISIPLMKLVTYELINKDC